MTSQYFSDEELGSKDRCSEDITIDIWNAIVAIYDKFVSNCALAGEFPQECSDSQIVCGCNKTQLEDALKGEVPELSVPVYRKSRFDEDSLPNKYAILDFIQFLYFRIKDPCEIGFHSVFNHNHYSFSDEGEFKAKFRRDINAIFSRNGVVFFIDEDGNIKRSIPKSLAKIISDIRFNTGDERLNELLEIAYAKFVLPHPDSRIESLEKIWDAFERMKTYFGEKKNKAANELIAIVSEGNELFSEYLTNEFLKELTSMGNKFQIRHFERDKVKLESNLHIDYLFYRMSCLIHLCVESLKTS